MDPFTHGVVGMALGLLGGGSVSFSNGLMTAAMIGGVLPDLDIIFQLRGDYAYLKRHRGFSHSLPSAVCTSLAGAFVLQFLYPEIRFMILAFGVFGGFLAHLFLDLLNSYGVQILWPFSRKKYSLNLLPLFDPLVVLISLFGILFQRGTGNYSGFFLIYLVYFLVRWALRRQAGRVVRLYLLRDKPRIYVLPSGRVSFFEWDFIAVTAKKNIVGSVNLLRGGCRIFRELQIDFEKELRNLIRESPLGQIFREFTPFFHIRCDRMENKFVCHFMDLRYRVKDRFMHNGIMVLDENREVENACFLPYSTAHRIFVS